MSVAGAGCCLGRGHDYGLVNGIDWSSLRSVVSHFKLTALSMLSTADATVVKFSLVLGGEIEIDHAGMLITYHVLGQVVFASAELFVAAFDTDQGGGTSGHIDVARAYFGSAAFEVLQKDAIALRSPRSCDLVADFNLASAILNAWTEPMLYLVKRKQRLPLESERKRPMLALLSDAGMRQESFNRAYLQCRVAIRQRQASRPK